MKKVLPWLCLIVVFIGCCAGCSRNKETSGPAEKADYSLIRKGENSYLVFDNPENYPPVRYEGLSIQEEEPIDFKDMDEFYHTVTKGLLSEQQKRHVNTVFAKDEEGNVLICDFDHLYNLRGPSRYRTYEIGWYGSYYAFRIRCENAEDGHVVLFPDKDLYDRVFKRYYTDELSDSKHYGILKTEQKDGIEYRIYSSENGFDVNVCYTLTQGDRTVQVKKYYRTEAAPYSGTLEDLHPMFRRSDTIPANIKLFSEEDGKWMMVDIWGPMTDMTDEEILQFDLVPYTPGS